jgi:hypothetical protein
MARFCARCGMELVAQKAEATWSLAKFVGWFIGIAIVILAVCAMGFFTISHTGVVMSQSQAVEQSENVEPEAEAQRDAIAHRGDGWWDAAEPDHLKPMFYGKQYLVEPSGWTSIDISMPITGSTQFRYLVELEGITRFRARPNGEVELEYTYPNGPNFRPYQMDGSYRTLLVQSLDGMSHRVWVKYVRVAKN